ncbi:VOC family protein [Fictibacillus sp. S7]|uniref:VOC family protein n=1 Tax=Fictibacillus sp. S7 TaxID=2212476 RepID=UPI001013881E|nr:VOC family protein [Fictibacillus sp. S7]RXZ00710.1 hypothetical protein DMO16_14065 [Fictibacillus sp. S7]
MQKVTPFLLFEGKAEEAIRFYTSTFKDSEVGNILYQENGMVLYATFTIKGQKLMAIDSMIEHGFTFTPALSLFIECDSGEELEEMHHKLSDNGKVLMPIADTPISEKFSWVEDRYGVSWQLNMMKK